MKNKRQARIIELISDSYFHTQEELTEALNKEGFRVTQATVSRDIREMKLAKRAIDGGSGYAYAVPGTTTGSIDKIILSSMISIRYALNNVVIKTIPGLAPAVASGIDGLEDPVVLGCVAGDDTVIVVTTDEIGADHICGVLCNMIDEKVSERVGAGE